MKITLIGYGKMGHEIEKIAVERGHIIDLIVDVENLNELKSDTFRSTDVAIEFTAPKAVLGNIRACFNADIPVVTGTTGWHNELGNIAEECRKGNHALFHASNFSIGVNLFFAINEFTARLLNNFPQYDAAITETHHIHKLDAPSGTAISLAEILVKQLDKKTSWQPDVSGDHILPVRSIREGEVTGIHEVRYTSEVDFIQLTHHAHSRKGFALGAVIAAEFIRDKAGIFTMRDLLGI